MAGEFQITYERQDDEMIAIIDYDAGNIKSVEKAMQLLGQEVIIAIILLSCLSYVVYQGYCPGHSLYIICQVNCYGLLYIKFKPEFNSIVIILYTILLVE